MDIMTKRVKLSQVNDGLAKSIASEYNLDSDSIELIRKWYPVESKSYLDAGTNEAVSYISTKSLDRDGEIVVPAGIDMKDYRKTPICLWCHKYAPDDVPLGKNIWIKSDSKGLIAKTKFHTRPGTMGEKVYNYLSDGFPLANSIGFISAESYGKEDFHQLDTKALGLDEKDVKRANRIHTRTILLEYSFVPVASNADSVMVSIGAKLCDLDDLKELGYEFAILEETPNEQIKPEEKEFAGGADSNGESQTVEIEEKSQGEEQEVITPEINVTINQSADVDPKFIANLVLASINKNSAGGLIIPEIGAGPDATANTFDFEIVKDVEEVEIKAPSCTCENCGETYPASSDGSCGTCPECAGEEDDKPAETEEDACKPKPKKEFCDCESFEGDEDTCKACGGGKKPKKFIEEDLLDSLMDQIAKMESRIDALQQLIPETKATEDLEGETIYKMQCDIADILKSGRRLSSSSINSLREALKLIEELIASSEPEPKAEEEKSFQMEPTQEPEFDLESTLKSSLEDIFSRKLKHLTAEDIVSEAIKKAKGEIF